MDTLITDLTGTATIGGAFLLSLILIMMSALKKESASLVHVSSIVGVIALGVIAVWTFPMKGSAFGGMVMTGGFASLFSLIFLLAALLTLMMMREYSKKINADHGEMYILVILATTGMMTFASGLDLIVTFIGLELMSICLYAMAGFTRKSLRANEAALKYFLLGSFASGFFLYGIALIYGAAGTTNIIRVAQNLPAYADSLLFTAGVGLLLVGLAFKVGSVPFHMWVPDVYEGSPTMVSAFMSTGAKAAAFAVLLLVFTATFAFDHDAVNTVFSVLAVASMIIGNVVALSQSSIKRMLAYSSIAHAGYMMIGLTAGSDLAISGVMFYLISYTLTNIGAFGIASIIENEKQENGTLSSFIALGTRAPLLALLMSIFMFSLVGIPPLSGFFGKYYIFLAAIQRGYTWLTIVGVITSMISIYFYLRVVVMMYFKTTDEAAAVSVGGLSAFTLVVAATGVVVIGILPRLVLDWMVTLF